MLQLHASETRLIVITMQVLKMHVGVLRPDFLERCQPDTSAFANGFKPSFGSRVVPPCRSPPSAELTDGHYAFPSGSGQLA